MGLFIESLWVEVFVFLTTLVVIVTSYFHNAYKFWEKKGVATIPPRFPLGNNNVLLPSGIGIGTISQHFYNEFKKQGEKFGGVYLITEPNLVTVDPDLIRNVLINDFQHFVNRGLYHNKEADPVSASLFFVDGLEWKNLRVKLTPTFTSGKMKMMFDQIIQCSNNLKQALDQSIGQDIEIKEVMGRFTTDAIGMCAFGIECNSFKHPNAEFRRMGKRIFVYGFWRSFQHIIIVNFPKLAKKLGFPVNNLDVQKFFTRIVEETVALREDKKIRRNDFLQMLIDMKNTINFTMDEMSAQTFLFFFAGFETSSTAMNFALYELARNPDIQEKVRQEVCHVLDQHNGQITYENLREMKYLQRVFDETLRKYPPLVVLNRNCSKEYTLPNTNIVIEPGTAILIPVLGLHMDPEHFPDPEKFDPERFTEENKKARHPFVYLPFGDGPRNCIGLRFGVMQSKIGIATVIKNFRLTVSPTTKPTKFNPYLFLLDTVDKIYLRAEKV